MILGASVILLISTVSGCTLLFPTIEDSVRVSMQGRLDELKNRLGDAARSAATVEDLVEAVIHDHALGSVVIRADDDRDDFEERQITSENITVYGLENDSDRITLSAVVAASGTGGVIEPRPIVGYSCFELVTGTGFLAWVQSRSAECPDEVVETSFSGATLIEVS